MVGKEQKIRLENIESRPRVRHFFVVDHFLWTQEMTPVYYPSYQITAQKNGFWLVYRFSYGRGSLETKFCLVGEIGGKRLSRKSPTRHGRLRAVQVLVGYLSFF